MARKKLNPHQQRMVREQSDLSIKVYALETFLLTELFKSLDKDEKRRLRRQLRHMRGYSDALAERIAVFLR